MSEPKTYEEALDFLLRDLRTTLIAKHKAYGTANLTEFGRIGILMRVADKYKRLKNLLYDHPELMNTASNQESADDTWKDMAGYAIQARMLDRKWLLLPVGEEK